MSVNICPACRKPYKNSSSAFCSHCGAPRPTAKVNHCTNPRCDNYDVDLGSDDLYCDACGNLTVLGKQIEDLT